MSGEDFTGTFSLVAKFTTLHVFLALVAHLDFEIHQVDVVAAYLQGDLDEEIYMEVPKGVKYLESEEHYWCLWKALYGLKQARQQWKKKLHDVLSNLGFVCSFSDDCLYIKKKREKIVLLVLVYVDNIVVSGPNGYYIISFKELLGNDFEITDLGKLKFMLGILITRDQCNWLIYLNQSSYISQILTQFGLQDATLVSTPLSVKHNLSVIQSSQSEAEKRAYKNYAGDIHYLSLVGSLLFATQT